MSGYGYNENCIEWIRDEKKATISLSQKSMISKVMKYAKSHPKECEVIAVNEDGSICAHVPTGWVKISPPKRVSDENRQRSKERMQRLHDEGKL